MSNFEKLVCAMRSAQKEYNKTPNADTMNYMEDLEDEVDGLLEFFQADLKTQKDVKAWLKARGRT